MGNDRDEHVFALTQSLELYDRYQAKMLDCDRKLECLIAALSNGGTKPVGKLLKRRVKTKDRSFAAPHRWIADFTYVWTTSNVSIIPSVGTRRSDI